MLRIAFEPAAARYLLIRGARVPRYARNTCTAYVFVPSFRALRENWAQKEGDTLLPQAN
jgi:hypothetical protein